MGIISLPGQFGGGNSHVHLFPFMIQLRKQFDCDMTGTYFNTITKLTIIMRVAGNFNDFDGGDGPERLRYQKKDNYIKVDLVIPELKWKDVPVEELKITFVRGIINSFYQLVQRAKKAGELVDESGLWEDFYRAVCTFLLDGKAKEFYVWKSVVYPPVAGVGLEKDAAAPSSPPYDDAKVRAILADLGLPCYV